jgi:cytochrome c-type biogenesis protein CcmH/NrfF
MELGRALGAALVLVLASISGPSSVRAADPNGEAAAEAPLPGAAASGAAASGGSSGESAVAGTRRSWAYDLATELMSPFCPGRTVASCPSPQAAELIQWIATQEAAGASREEVVAMLIERYGEEILGAPPARGITLWAYVFPVLGFVAFGAIAVVVLRRIVAPSAASSAGSSRGAASVSGAAQAPAPDPTRPAAGPRAPDPAADELARIVDAELAERA